MWKMCRSAMLVLACSAVVLAAFAQRASAETRYRLIALSGEYACSPHRVIGKGLILGLASSDDGSEQSGLWRVDQPAAAPLLLTRGRCLEVEAIGMSDSGLVVGAGVVRSESGEEVTGLVWNARSPSAPPRTLKSLDRGTARAVAVNNKGRIVGIASSLGTNRAVVWDAEKPDEWPKVLRGREAMVMDINDAGVAVGIIEDEEGPVVGAVFWDTSRPTDPPRALKGPAGQHWMPMRVNEKGMVVGYGPLEEKAKQTHVLCADLSRPDAPPKDLGTLGAQSAPALNMNDAGQIVGASPTKAGELRATLWENDRVIDLNDLVTNAPGWRLYYATGISNEGEIIGLSVKGKAQKRFLLIPVKATSAVEPARAEMEVRRDAKRPSPAKPARSADGWELFRPQGRKP